MKLLKYLPLVIFTYFNAGSLSGQPTLVLIDQPEIASYGTIEVRGLDSELLTALTNRALTGSEWRTIFSVYTGDATGIVAGQPAMLGRYTIEPEIVRFTPRFPLVKDLDYTAIFRQDPLSKLLDETSSPTEVRASFSLERQPGSATTEIEQIFPVQDELPENLLKFYIHFSAPMRRGQIYRFIHLVDASGDEVNAPFLELEPELWDSEGKRLTLFFDPGRIKRGLRPNLDLGTPLKAGNNYSLEFDRDMKDMSGATLRSAHRKSFRVTPADRRSPDAADWQVAQVTARTREALVLHLGEALDHALLKRMIQVVGPDGRTVVGQSSVSEESATWSFLPERPWAPGGYRLRINPLLEDLAGNMMHRLFDDDSMHSSFDGNGEAVAFPFVVQ